MTETSPHHPSRKPTGSVLRPFRELRARIARCPERAQKLSGVALSINQGWVLQRSLENKTRKEIAAELNISSERVRQIEIRLVELLGPLFPEQSPPPPGEVDALRMPPKESTASDKNS